MHILTEALRPSLKSFISIVLISLLFAVTLVELSVEAVSSVSIDNTHDIAVMLNEIEPGTSYQAP